MIDDAKKNCMQILSVSLNPPNTSMSSGVFDAVSGMLDASTQADTVPDFVDVQFNNVDLQVDIAGAGSSALQEPTFSRSTAPRPPNVAPPSLTRATYEAFQSLIAYAHTSPVIQDIVYPEYVEAVGTLNSRPADPPLDYPQADLLGTYDWAKPAEPAKPDMYVEDYPDWQPIRRRDFQPLDLSLLEFDYSDLVYEPPDVREMEQRTELRYDDDLDLRERIKQILLGTDEEVNQWLLRTTQESFMAVALRGRREKVSKEIEQAFEAAAARNISLPYGGLDAIAAEIAEAELDEKYVAIQEVRGEVYEAATNAVITSMQRALQIENNHFQLFMRYARQNLQVYKLNLQLATTAYEAVLGIFDKIVQALNTEVEAYNQYVSAMMAQNSALGDQASLTQAQVQSFLAKVQAYSTRIDVKRAATEVVSTDVRLQTMDVQAYGARLQADLANVQIVEQNIDAFRKAIKAHSDSFKWYDEAMGAYESWLSAKTSAIDVNESKVQAYSKLWSSEDRRISAFSDYVSQSISQMEAEIQRYKEAVRTQREFLSGISQAANSTMQAINAYESAVRDEQGYVRDYNSASISFQAGQYSQSISEAKKELAQQSIDAESEAQFARLEAAKAAATLVTAGALAQAANTIMQVSVGARGSASENVSGQDSGVLSTSVQNSKSWRKACRKSYNYSENAPE